MRALALTMALTLGVAASAAGQALVPAKGDAFASVLFTNMAVDNHFLPAHRVDVGQIDSNIVLFDLTYGVTDRLAVTIGIPLVTSRYSGAFPHQPGNPDAPDNSGWNSTFSDFRFNLRYNVVRGPVAITPYVGTIVPSHGYEYVAHAAPGKNLRELQVGVAAAGLLDRWVPGLFAQGRYGFAVVEESIDIRPNHSSADLEIGYFLPPSVRIFAMAAGRYSHAGIDLPVPAIARVVLTPEQLQSHDQIVREHYLNLSAGVSFSVSDTVDLFASFMKQTAGRNTHEVARAVSIGMSWAFRRSTLEDMATAVPTAPIPIVQEQTPARKSLLRCLCQKAGG